MFFYSSLHGISYGKRLAITNHLSGLSWTKTLSGRS